MKRLVLIWALLSVIAQDVAAETFTLAEGQAYTTEQGITFTFIEQRHKHKVKGGAIGIWELSISKDTEVVSVEHRGEELLVEGVAFGCFYSMSTREYGQVNLTVSEGTPEPMDEEEAAELGRQVVLEHGCQGNSMTYSISSGVLKLSRMADGEVRCTVYIGLYSREALKFL